jgi:hypothetical protein
VRRHGSGRREGRTRRSCERRGWHMAGTLAPTLYSRRSRCALPNAGSSG